LLGGLWSELDLKGVVGLGCDRVAQVRLELEGIVRDSIESSSSWDLTVILKDDFLDAIFANSGLFESEDWSSVSVMFFDLIDLERWKSTFSSELEDKLAILSVLFSILNNGFEHTSVGLHGSWVEAHSDVLVLVWLDGQLVWLDFESESFTL
jgi:hypothetical protein